MSDIETIYLMFSLRYEEGQTPLAFSHTLESFLFSIGILKSSHDCVYPSSLQGVPLSEESKDFVVQWWIFYFLVLLEVAFQHFVRDLCASFPYPVTAGIVHLLEGTKCSSSGMYPRFINTTGLICNFSKTKKTSDQCWTNVGVLYKKSELNFAILPYHSPVSFLIILMILLWRQETETWMFNTQQCLIVLLLLEKGMEEEKPHIGL